VVRMGAVPLQHTNGIAAASERRVTLLGATGSIGTSTIDLLKRQPDRYRVEAVTGGRNAAALAQLACELGAQFAAIADPAAYPVLKEALAGTGIQTGAGEAAVIEAARRPADWVIAAITGAAGLKPTLAAAQRGAIVALANKECLVCAGAAFMRTAAATGATVLPVDSEHNAIFQALSASPREAVRRIILTASGGPFRDWPLARIRNASIDEALKHPNWSMGPKITIDSATMMNKGLEIIEAHHLFDLAPDEIDVLVHPQSIVHGMVEFTDGSVVAQLGPPDMRVPIAHCLAWPHRIQGANRLRFDQMTNLTFQEPDFARFPALRLASEALRAGAGAPTVLNAANEVAVAEFLGSRLRFCDIAALVEATLDASASHGLLREPDNMEQALALDHHARRLAQDLLPEIAAKTI